MRVIRSTTAAPSGSWTTATATARSPRCGHGIRLFVRYLVDAGLADGAAPIRVDTRDGVKVLTSTATSSPWTSAPQVLGETVVSVDRLEFAARTSTWATRTRWPSSSPWTPRVRCSRRPGTTRPVPGRRQRRVRRTPGRSPCRHAGPRAWIGRDALLRDRRLRRDGRHGSRGFGPRATRDLAYRVDVPGGTLTVTWTVDDRVLLTGPAVVVAAGDHRPLRGPAVLTRRTAAACLGLVLTLLSVTVLASPAQAASTWLGGQAVAPVDGTRTSATT